MKRSDEREAAKAAGEKYYFTGKPCRRGHIALRQVSNWGCVECHAIALATFTERLGGEEAFGEYERKRQSRSRAEKPEQHRARLKAYRTRQLALDPSFYAKIARQQRAKHPDTHLRAVKNWIGKNKDKHLDYTRAANAKRRAASGTFTRQDILNLHKKQNGKCANCGKKPEKSTVLEIDHIVPLSKGGSNNPGNLQLLCRKCNRSKSNCDPVVFAQLNGRLL